MEDRCVVCGEIVPEGTHVCALCKLANNVPCHTCKKHSESCHVYCKDYLEFYKARQRKREIDSKRRDEDEYFIRRTKEKQAIMRRKGDLKCFWTTKK